MLQYCPTADMIADFFTKPLQGRLFRKLRAFILNLPYDDEGEDHGDDSENAIDSGVSTDSTSTCNPDEAQE